MPVKPKNAKADQPQASKTQRTAARNAALAEKIVELKAKGLKWDEIADKVGLGAQIGKTWYLWRQATISPKDKIKGFLNMTPVEKRKIVKQMRADKLSWGEVSIRCGITEDAARKIFDPETRGRGSRIGKGGRYPNGEAPTTTTRTPSTRKAQATTPSGGAKVAAGKAKGTKTANAAAPGPRRTTPPSTEAGVQKTQARRTQGRARVRRKSSAA